MKDGRSRNVCLVADDDLFIRQVLSKMLDGLADVIHAADGADCLKLYQEHQPDMAFLDIHLPILTGIELIDQILKMDPSAYLVVMSSDSTADNVQAALRHGSRGFLAKPIQRIKLMHYVNGCPTIRWADQRSAEG